MLNEDDYAFPTRSDEHAGLTVREYFAAIAMQAIVASPSNSGMFEIAARDACKYADALIAALNATPSRDDF